MNILNKSNEKSVGIQEDGQSSAQIKIDENSMHQGFEYPEFIPNFQGAVDVVTHTSQLIDEKEISLSHPT